MITAKLKPALPMNDAEWRQHWKDLRDEYNALTESEQLPFIFCLVSEGMEAKPACITPAQIINAVLKELLPDDSTAYQTAYEFCLAQ